MLLRLFSAYPLRIANGASPTALILKERGHGSGLADGPDPWHACDRLARPEPSRAQPFFSEQTHRRARARLRHTSGSTKTYRAAADFSEAAQ